MSQWKRMDVVIGGNVYEDLKGILTDVMDMDYEGVVEYCEDKGLANPATTEQFEIDAIASLKDLIGQTAPDIDMDDKINHAVFATVFGIGFLVGEIYGSKNAKGSVSDS